MNAATVGCPGSIHLNSQRTTTGTRSSIAVPFAARTGSNPNDLQLRSRWQTLKTSSLIFTGDCVPAIDIERETIDDEYSFYVTAVTTFDIWQNGFVLLKFRTRSLTPKSVT